MRVPAAACLVFVTFAAATAAAATPSEVAAVTTAQTPAPAPTAVENFSYNPEGRRDPFVSSRRAEATSHPREQVRSSTAPAG